MEAHETGTLPGTGSFRCVACDFVLSLAPVDELPVCPSCGGIEFRRASLFTEEFHAARRPPVQDEDAEWLEQVRDGVTEPGQYLAFGEDRESRIVALTREWTRIGRSLAADVRFDDPSVSRRHALLVRGHDGVRVLDDRSLNGVFVNGERVEWSSLNDGDEIIVGSHSLHFIDVSAEEIVREGVRSSRPAVDRDLA
jgi:pSer/pThr/pTyr-binding forkhead associated (FHA) protein